MGATLAEGQGRRQEAGGQEEGEVTPRHSGVHSDWDEYNQVKLSAPVPDRVLEQRYVAVQVTNRHHGSIRADVCTDPVLDAEEFATLATLLRNPV